jgi:hypothetical protein
MALLGDLVRQTGERRNRVSALCAGFARDRAGAHRAWFGPLLFEGRTAKAPAEVQRPATPKAQARSHQPAHEPAQAAEPSIAPSPRAKKRSFKGSKKH